MRCRNIVTVIRVSEASPAGAKDYQKCNSMVVLEWWWSISLGKLKRLSGSICWSLNVPIPKCAPSAILRPRDLGLDAQLSAVDRRFSHLATHH